VLVWKPSGLEVLTSDNGIPYTALALLGEEPYSTKSRQVLPIEPNNAAATTRLRLKKTKKKLRDRMIDSIEMFLTPICLYRVPLN
jgi:hypothetical protein